MRARSGTETRSRSDSLITLDASADRDDELLTLTGGVRHGAKKGSVCPVICELAPVKVTAVYETYWRFAYERQRIYMKRLAGEPAPWTDDPILQVHRFTNAYRAADRVSQYLIGQVIYRGDQTTDEVFFRTLLFRMFNRIETWELLTSTIDTVEYSDGSGIEAVEHVLLDVARAGTPLYSPAYIMPPVPNLSVDYKFQGHLALLSQMMVDGLPIRVARAESLEEVFRLLRGYPGLGDFLAFQFTIDLNYSRICDFPESEFVVPGPGALNGIAKSFSDLGGLSESEVIYLMTDVQIAEFDRLGLDFTTLRGRLLQPVDIQNLFCEIDKYSRVAHPEIQGASSRSRIKQKYKPLARPLPPPWFPPKWGISNGANPSKVANADSGPTTQPSLFS